MTCPRIDVDLAKVRHNTRVVVERLQGHRIQVSAVTKAVCGHPAIARALLDGGAICLAEARLSNVKRLRKAGLTCPITLIRTPMLSQIDDVVRLCEASYNTEMAVITELAAAAIRQNKTSGIILMVEMGDQREGILPQHLVSMARRVVAMPGVHLNGIGANFACLSGIAPTPAKMQALSDLANDVERQCGTDLQTVSGGNSANLSWALSGSPTGRINDLRVGEAILLGLDPVTGNQIAGLYRDALTIVAEVIETDAKSVSPMVGSVSDTLAKVHLVSTGTGNMRLIFAIGHQDTDAAGLTMPPGHSFIGATSDHLVIGTDDPTLCVGSEMRFQMNYHALMRAMGAPDIQINIRNEQPGPKRRDAHGPTTCLALV